MIIANFSGPDQGKAIGTWTAWTGIAFIVGPLLGGALVDVGSWRWVFAINVLPIAATLAVLARIPPEPPRAERQPRRSARARSCARWAWAAIIFGLIEAPDPRLGRAGDLSAARAAAPCAFAALPDLRALRAASDAGLQAVPQPQLRDGQRRDGRDLRRPVGVHVRAHASSCSRSSGYSATAAGLALLPVTVLMFVLSPVSGRLAGKHGPRWFMTFGPLIAAAGFLLMLRMRAHAAYFTRGAARRARVRRSGWPCTVSPLTAAILGGIDQRHAGIGSAINNAIARVAGLLAVAAIGAILAARFSAAARRRRRRAPRRRRARAFLAPAAARPLDTSVPAASAPTRRRSRRCWTDASVSALQGGAAGRWPATLAARRPDLRRRHPQPEASVAAAAVGRGRDTSRSRYDGRAPRARRPERSDRAETFRTDAVCRRTSARLSPAASTGADAAVVGARRHRPGPMIRSPVRVRARSPCNRAAPSPGSSPIEPRHARRCEQRR